MRNFLVLIKSKLELMLFDRSITITVQALEDVTEEDDIRKTFKRQQTFQRSSKTIPFIPN